MNKLFPADSADFRRNLKTSAFISAICGRFSLLVFMQAFIEMNKAVMEKKGRIIITFFYGFKKRKMHCYRIFRG